MNKTNNKAIYDKAARDIAETFYENNVAMKRSYIDWDKGYMDKVVDNVTYFARYLNIDYDYIWNTAYKMYQDMMVA